MSGKNHDPLGSLTYDDKVIEKIVTLTLAEISDFLVIDQKITKELISNKVASNARDIEVTVKGENVIVAADIIVEYGCNIPTLYEKATNIVKQEIERMTTLTLGELHLYVREILPIYEFQELFYNVSMVPVQMKARPEEQGFARKINHFVSSITGKNSHRNETTIKEHKTKTKLLNKKTDAKTREFVTDLKTKTTNFGKTKKVNIKGEQAKAQDIVEDNGLLFANVTTNTKHNEAEQVIELDIDNKKGLDKTLNAFEVQESITEKK